MFGIDLQFQLTDGLRGFRIDLVEETRPRSSNLSTLGHELERTSKVAFPRCNVRIVIFIDIEAS